MQINRLYFPYFTDQINHSVYHLNSSGQSVQSDIIYKSVMLDGTIKKPLGSYSFDSFYVPDSMDSYNYFSWKQGDYLLRDLTLGSRYILVDSSKVSLHANGRSFAGKNALQGPDILEYNNNSLQNYYLDYIVGLSTGL